MNPRTVARTAVALAAAAAAFAVVRDNIRYQNDGLTNRQRRYHARQWAAGSGRKPTKAEMDCLRELVHARKPPLIVDLPPVP